MMWTRRLAVLSALALCVLLVGASPVVADDDGDIKVKGFANVPGTSVVLPLVPGSAPITIDVTFGVPSVTLPVQVTPDTKIKSKLGLPVRIADGDAVKVKMVVAGSVLQASRLELESFPELELDGFAADLPPAGVTLPLAPGATLDFTVVLGSSGVEIPVRLTSTTKVRHNLQTLRNDDAIQVDAVVRGGLVVATDIKAGHEEDEDD
jgi:hypothetical protein